MEVKDFFEENNKLALAFFGDVESSYLLKLAVDSGVDVTAYFVKTEFQSQAQLSAAIKTAAGMRVKMKIVHDKVLKDPMCFENSSELKAFCKKNILKNVLSVAKKDGYSTVIDGCVKNDRLETENELGVLSPLASAELTHENVVENAKKFNIFERTKPSYSNLASRVAYGEEVNRDKLEIIEICEDYLADMGFLDYRLKTIKDVAVLEVAKGDAVVALGMREELLKQFKPFYSKVTLDLQFRN